MSKAVCNDKGDEIALSWSDLIYQCAKELEIDLEKDIDIDGKSYPEITTEIAKIIVENDGIDYKQAIKKLKEKIAEITSWYPEKRIEKSS